MSKTTFAALATAIVAVATMGGSAAEAGKYHGHGHGHGYAKHYKPHYSYGYGHGYRHWGHTYGYGYGYKYGKCAVWSYSGKYCVKWW